MNKPSPSLLAEINEVQHMYADQLLRKYARFFKGGVTRCTATLRQEVIYHLQREHYGMGISEATSAVLNSSLERREERIKDREALIPGTQFTREWHGEKHILVYRGPKQVLGANRDQLKAVWACPRGVKIECEAVFGLRSVSYPTGV